VAEKQISNHDRNQSGAAANLVPHQVYDTSLESEGNFDQYEQHSASKEDKSERNSMDKEGTQELIAIR
jgi:hypothetical protein